MEREDPRPQLSGHIVICNCNEKVRRIVAELHGSAEGDLDIVLLAQDQTLWQENPAWHPKPSPRGRFFVAYGCATDDDDLESVRIADARAAVILADPRHGALADPRSTLVAIAIERQNPQVHTVMELLSSKNRVHVRSSEVNEIICLGEISEKLIAQSCISPGIKHVFDHLLSSSPQTNQLFVQPLPASLAGATFRQLARRSVERQAPFILCGFELGVGYPIPAVDEVGLLTGPAHFFVLNPRSNCEPGKDTALTIGDKLVLLAFARPDLQCLETTARSTTATSAA